MLFELPPDWEPVRSEGDFPDMVYLVHPVCGFRTAFAYNLSSVSELSGGPAARQIVTEHSCPVV